MFLGILVVLFLGFTDNGLGVVARDIVEHDSVIVEIVEDSNAELVSLSVVGLGAVGTEENVIKTGSQI